MKHNEWVKTKIDSLLTTPVKSNGVYNESVIREYLVFSGYEKQAKKLVDFFNDYTDDENLLQILFQILLDESEDFSNDARYSAAKYIPIFSQALLQKHKDKLLYAQNYPLQRLRPYPDGNTPAFLHQS